jgi:hypothetical protein
VKKQLYWFGALFLVTIVLPIRVVAQYSSTNYKVEETFIGTGGTNEATSASYVSRASLGDLVVGRTASSQYQAYGGFTTTDQEYLEFAVIGGTFDFGELTTATTGLGVTTFSVRNYLSSGYIVKVTGTPLRNPSGSGYSLAGMSVPTTSTAGVEQFGVNLKDNATPNIGAEPVQAPDTSFSFGQVASGYDIANQYKYVANDTVAFSNTSTGTTTFSMSMIANVSAITPGGDYATTLSLVAIPTF